MLLLGLAWFLPFIVCSILQIILWENFADNGTQHAGAMMIHLIPGINWFVLYFYLSEGILNDIIGKWRA